MCLLIDKVDTYYVVSYPRRGAISVLAPQEFIAFTAYFSLQVQDKDELVSFYKKLGYASDIAARKAIELENKLNQDGWMQSEGWIQTEEPLRLVYLNITKACNFTCAYCYRGDNRSCRSFAKQADLRVIIQKIKTMNSSSHIVVTGGEPFMHNDLLGILDYLEQEMMTFSLLTNGSLLSDDICRKLAVYHGLLNIQISIDGASREVHALTRGDTFDCVMRGIKNVANHLLPFSLAPTVHDGNAHEIGEIARLAYAEGGDITPNNLRSIPGNNMEELKLTPSNLIESLRQIGHVLKNEAPQELIKRIARKGKAEDGESPVYRKTVCGAGHSVVAIDHIGDVFPCHLLERPELLLGNALTDEWPVVLKSAKRLGVRCSSLDIPKCSACHFATTCAGGCRADAFFHHGIFLAEDSMCELMYYLNMKSLMDQSVEKSSDHKGRNRFDSYVTCTG